MSNFEVYPKKMNTQATNISNIKKQILNLKNQLDRCNNILRYCLSPESSQRVRNSIVAMSNSLDQQLSHLSQLSSGLLNVANTYSNTENNIKSGKISLSDLMKFFTSTTKSILNGGSLSDSIIAGSLSGATTIFGTVASGTISGSVLGYEASGKKGIKWKIDPETGKLKDASAEISGDASVYGAKGSAEGKYGMLSGAVSGSLLNAGVHGAIGASLFKDGKLSPSVSAEVKAKANVAEGEAKVQYGDKNYNAHGKASGEVLGASAEASGKAGVITYKDDAGNEIRTIGAQAKVGAEAYAAQGSISGGITIFGVKIDASVSGKAGGAGVSASGQVTGNGVSGSIGAGLGLGAGLSVSVDWSGAVDNILGIFGGNKSTPTHGSGGGGGGGGGSGR